MNIVLEIVNKYNIGTSALPSNPIYQWLIWDSNAYEHYNNITIKENTSAAWLKFDKI